MKNIEGLGKGKNFSFPGKISTVIKRSNELLMKDLNNKDIFSKVKIKFNKLLKYGKFFISKIKTEKDFEDFMLGLEKILKDLEIEKLYNITTIGNLKEYTKRDLFYQFLYISLPLNNPDSFGFIKGGACYHWTLFFYDLFEQIDTEKKLKKELVNFSPDYNHSVFVASFEGKKYVIDPYAKSNGLITEVKKGNKLYLGANMARTFFGNIENKDNLLVSLDEQEIAPLCFIEKEKFIDSVNSNQVLNIKVYYKGKGYQLSLKDTGDKLFLNFDGNLFEMEKDFILLDIVGLFMESCPTNYDILTKITQFSDTIPLDIKDVLKIMSEKINFDYVFKKLGIYEDIQMFRS